MLRLGGKLAASAAAILLLTSCGGDDGGSGGGGASGGGSSGVGSSGGGSGGGGDNTNGVPGTAIEDYVSPNPESLSTGDVQKVIAQAAAQAKAAGTPATIAVVDRVGNVLAVFAMSGAPEIGRAHV